MTDPPTSDADLRPRFCTACGAALDPVDRFCGACGAPVEEPAAAPVLSTGDETGVPAAAEGGGLRSLSGLALVTVGFAMAALLVGAVAILLWTQDDGPTTRTIVGAVTAIDEGYAGSVGEPCGVGTEDFRPSVTVVPGDDPDGEAFTVEASDGRIGQLFQCRFTFAVTGLPDAEVYRFSLEGGEARELTRDELEASGWRVETTLGGLGG